MQRAISRLGLSSFLASVCLMASVARGAEPKATPADDSKAADDKASPSGDATESDAAPKKEEDSEAATKPAAPAAEQADKVADAQAGNSPVELPGKTYRFIGARYRGIIVPKFMQNLFASGGRTVYVHAFGPEFAIRKDGFEYNLAMWLGLYNMDDTGFKGKNDGENAWELIKANIQILYLTSDFLWSHEFTPELALNYGVGAGFGFVFGTLNRVQSYPTVPGQDPNNYSKCIGQFVPNPVYCDNSNNHYGSYEEPSWANGGSKPILFPWLALQTGLRYKPSRSFAARLDLGFGTSGFFFGLGGDYGL